MFAFGSDLATTAPYDLRLTEVLMTRGSDSMAVPKKLDAKGCFPIDESVARRLAKGDGIQQVRIGVPSPLPQVREGRHPAL